MLIRNSAAVFALLIVASVANAGECFPITHQVTNDMRLVELGHGRAVEQLRGQAARAHLQSLLARRPAALKKSHSRLVERGFTPSDEVFVERTLRKISGPVRGAESYRRAQTSGEYAADGEILFWSYDGPGYTWQGTIYLNVYGWGEATWDGQIDTDSYDYPWTWVYQTWSETCPEGSCPGDDEDGLAKLVPPRPGSPYVFAKLNSVPLTDVYRRVAFNNFYDWSTCWRQNVIGGCVTAAAVCWRVKAAFPACWAAGCIGVEVGYGIGCAFN